MAVKTWVVIWSVIACWIAGSEASGVIVATYRSELVTWLRAHTATPASGASTHPSTISRTATMVRHRWRPPGRGGWGAASSLGAQGRVLGPQPVQLRPLVLGQSGFILHLCHRHSLSGSTS
jgi:hypothetical protein